MKILILGHKQIQHLTGGIESVVTDLAEHLGDDGHQVTVMNRRPIDEPEFTYKRMKNVRMINIPTVSNPKLTAVLYSFSASMQTLLENYDVINIHAEGQCFWIPLMKLRWAAYLLLSAGTLALCGQIQFGFQNQILNFICQVVPAGAIGLLAGTLPFIKTDEFIYFRAMLTAVRKKISSRKQKAKKETV